MLEHFHAVMDVFQCAFESVHKMFSIRRTNHAVTLQHTEMINRMLKKMQGASKHNYKAHC
jgi:hypothetical protein